VRRARQRIIRLLLLRVLMGGGGADESRMGTHAREGGAEAKGASLSGL
jgi:hypothetical protein